MNELEFLDALHVELLRHRELREEHWGHELFQTSTVQALMGGAFDGDVTLAEVLEHGDLGLGTLDGLDGELIIVDGEPWKAELDGSLTRPDRSTTTPYAVVVPFSPGDPLLLRGPLRESDLDRHVRVQMRQAERSITIRIDGRFEAVHVRSVPRQERPYPPLAEVIAHQQVTELADVSGTMVGFCFPDPLGGIEMVGWHLHFVTDDRALGGHVLSYTLLEATARLDEVSTLHVELPPAVALPSREARLDEAELRRLETDR